MIEVEIKLPLFRRSITERALTDCGFKAGNLVKESDFYFTSDFHDFMKTDEALRIRTCENFTTRETTSFLTYKGAKLDTVSTTRKELETRIEDADIAREILISLGYKKLYPVTKLRQYYHKGRMTACVDQVESLWFYESGVWRHAVCSFIKRKRPGVLLNRPDLINSCMYRNLYC